MDQAGILEVNQRAYLGHGPKTITDLYRWHDVVRFLNGGRRKTGGISGGIARRGACASPYEPAGDRTRGLRIKSQTLESPFHGR